MDKWAHLTEEQKDELYKQQCEERWHAAVLGYLRMSSPNREQTEEFIGKMLNNTKNLSIAAKTVIQMTPELTEEKQLGVLPDREQSQLLCRLVDIFHRVKGKEQDALSYVYGLLMKKNPHVDHNDYLEEVSVSPHDLAIAAYTAELMFPGVLSYSPVSKADLDSLLTLDELKATWAKKDPSAH